MTRLYGAKGWMAIAASALVLFVVFPLLSLAVPQASPLHLSQYWVTLAGTVYAALGLGIVNKLIESWQGAVIAKILVLVFIVVFIQKRPQGMFAVMGRAVEA